MSVLIHHGIKGQKWGVRRFQNDDGTLTPSGKKRYSVSGYTRDTGPRMPEMSRKADEKVASVREDIRQQSALQPTKNQMALHDPSEMTKDFTTRALAVIGSAAIGGLIIKSGYDVLYNKSESQSTNKAKSLVRRAVSRGIRGYGSHYIRKNVRRQTRKIGKQMLGVLDQVSYDLSSTRR